ncbi:Arm DNA-binding domain-containing protein [Pseudomonadota bacterium]
MKRHKYAGVYANKDSISFVFNYEQKLTKRTLKLLPTATNLLYAYNMRCKIIEDIEKGIFSLEEYDKNHSSGRISSKPSCENNTFGHFIEYAFESEANQLSPNTEREYKQIAQSLKNILKDRNILKISPSDLRIIFNKHLGHLQHKKLNEYLIIWRKALSIAQEKYDHIKYKPEDFSCYKFVETPPKPYSIEDVESLWSMIDEIDLIINYLILCIFTGLRPGELIALSWYDIDLVNRKLHVRRGMLD